MGLCGSKTPSHEEDHSLKIELGGGNVHLVTTMDMWEEKLSEANKHGKIVVADFSVSWCSPRKKIAPTYLEFADKYPNMMFLTVDVDELAKFSTSWDIKATPTFFFHEDGRQVDKHVGANKDELEKKIAAFANRN